MARVISRKIADNIDLVIEEHPHFRSGVLGYWLLSGSRAELKPQHFGVSHFIEHLLFKGTKTRTAAQIAEALEARGGDLNAFTDREMTCYHAQVLQRDLNVACDLLAEMLFESTFPAVEVERERGVILQEIAMVEDDPEEWVHDLFFELVWKDSPLAHSILGTRKSIEALSRKEVVNWHHTILKNSPIVVTAAGPEKAEVMAEMITRALERRGKNIGREDVSVSSAQTSSKAKSSKRGKEKPLNLRPSFHAGKYFLQGDFEQSHVVVGFPGLPLSAEDRYTLLLIHTFLGGGMSSRLFQTIREEMGAAYSVYSSVNSLAELGVFQVYVGTSPKKVKEVLKVVEEEVEHLQAKPLSDEQLNAVKDKLTGSVLMQADSMESRMISLARNQIVFNRQITPDEVVAKIQATTAKEIQNLAKNIFGLGESCTMLLGPKGSTAGQKFAPLRV
jgi:predicted Zn-dependent peptidase